MSVPLLADGLLKAHGDDSSRAGLSSKFQFELAAGHIENALTTLALLKSLPEPISPSTAPSLFAHEIYARALRSSGDGGAEFSSAYAEIFGRTLEPFSDRDAYEFFWYLETPGFIFTRLFEGAQQNLAAIGNADVDQADRRSAESALVRAWLSHEAYNRAAPELPQLIQHELSRRYDIKDDQVISTEDGAELSALIVRPRSSAGPAPVALNFTIYTDEAANHQRALYAASRGYISVVADARGKRLSSSKIVPYEHEVDDTHAVIDWISRQSWSNGEVAMYGGSYEGFTAWAATKRMHPALKTIVAYASAIPGQGLPMMNNVFLNANYGWGFYVSNNRTLDTETYSQFDRWSNLNTDWFMSGRPYREIDSVDGTPNPLLQRWLEHPAYDEYWQKMVPYEKDYESINIPVLTVTGYYDDGQISALQYLRDHYHYNPGAEHYLVIGPYDHLGVSSFRKPMELRGYNVDPVAQMNTQQLAFDWIDHVLKGRVRPQLVADRVNFQVMGTNSWRHAPSIPEMADTRLRLYMGSAAVEGEGLRSLASVAIKNSYALSTVPAAQSEAIAALHVDLTDRSEFHNDYYPNPIEGAEPGVETGLVFVTTPFAEPLEVSGSFSGQFRIAINKRDVDLGAVLYALLPDGRLFHLSYYLGRASYAEDPSVRKLLEPGRITDIAFDRTVMVSKRIEAGSRLVLVVDVNKNPWHQLNYGTGRDVSDESVADAGEPLSVTWHSGSYIDVPVRRLSVQAQGQR